MEEILRGHIVTRSNIVDVYYRCLLYGLKRNNTMLATFVCGYQGIEVCYNSGFRKQYTEDSRLYPVVQVRLCLHQKPTFIEKEALNIANLY